MKDSRKTEIRVGVTIALSVVLLIWILGWAKNINITSDEKLVSVKFSNVNGLEAGDNVTVNGVRKGNVEQFKIIKDEVIVTLRLKGDVSLKEDAEFNLMMLDLMGGKKVDINPGRSEKELNYKTVHQGRFIADIPAVMAMIGSAQEDLFKVLEDVKITLSSINNYLTDEELGRDIKAAADNLSDVSRKLNLMIDENREAINQLADNSVELTREAAEFIRENKDDVKASIGDLKSVLKRTDTLLVRVNLLAEETVNKQNALGKMIYDESILNDLKQSLKQVNELTRILIEQLKESGIKIDANIF